MALVNGYTINIYIPCNTPPAMPLDYSQLERACPALTSITDYLKQAHPFARLGKYDGNFELTFGYEGFTPRVGSNPRHGQADVPTTPPVVILTTFVTEQPSEERIEKFINDVRALHPWEHPVITFTAARIFIPDDAL